MNNTQPSLFDTSIEQFYAEAFRHYDKGNKVPPISVEFYPYSGINHTIRLRGGQAYVRISEVCREMLPEGQRALAFILVAKLFRRRAGRVHQETYNDCLKTNEIQSRAAKLKVRKRRKILVPPEGTIFDLNELFETVNSKYFEGSIKKPVLSWSPRKTYRVLGHHDATHNTIVISRSLDTPETPRFIIEYVMFHEMLHIAHPTKHLNGRRYNHTPEFRRDERKFPKYQAAENWIESNVRRLKRAAKKK
ncbi:MAG: SprT-like domain-containing protein [Pyrinomonadaceae bacterium]